MTVERLNNELQIQRARYDQLAAEAAALPDVKSYDAIQHELEVLKALVYPPCLFPPSALFCNMTT